MGRRRAWHYPQYLGSTQALSTVPTLPTVPRLYLQYPECPATGITLALDCYYLAPALHTQQPSLFGGRLLWRSMLLEAQNKKETESDLQQLLWRRERAEPFHSLECTGSLKPAFQTSFESYLPRNNEKNSSAYKCILVVVVFEEVDATQVSNCLLIRELPKVSARRDYASRHPDCRNASNLCRLSDRLPDRRLFAL